MTDIFFAEEARDKTKLAEVFAGVNDDLVDFVFERINTAACNAQYKIKFSLEEDKDYYFIEGYQLAIPSEQFVKLESSLKRLMYDVVLIKNEYDYTLKISW